MDEREREIESPFHSAGVAFDPPVGGVDETDPLEQLVRARDALVARQPLEGRLEAQVLPAREQRIERGLLQRGADRLPDIRPLFGDVEAADARDSRRRRQQRREHQHGRRFAGAVRTEKAVDLARRDREVDAVDGARAFLELPDEGLGLDCELAAHRGPVYRNT